MLIHCPTDLKIVKQAGRPLLRSGEPLLHMPVCNTKHNILDGDIRYWIESSQRPVTSACFMCGPDLTHLGVRQLGGWIVYLCFDAACPKGKRARPCCQRSQSAFGPFDQSLIRPSATHLSAFLSPRPSPSFRSSSPHCKMQIPAKTDLASGLLPQVVIGGACRQRQGLRSSSPGSADNSSDCCSGCFSTADRLLLSRGFARAMTIRENDAKMRQPTSDNEAIRLASSRSLDRI